MSKSLLYIDLVLENVEVITLKRKDIKVFTLLDYKNKFDNNYKEAEVFMEIKKEADNDKGMRPLAKKIRLYNGLTSFSRLLKYPDITHIEFYYDDKSTEIYSVIWEGNENNKFQETYIDEETGNLCIEIKS